MSKLEDWLVGKGLMKPREGLLPNHVRELLDLTIKMRIERYTKWEIQNYLSLTKDQADWLWKNSLLFNSEVDDDRRRWLERERDGSQRRGEGGDSPGPPSGDSTFDRKTGYGRRYHGCWRAFLVYASTDLSVSPGGAVPELRSLEMAIRRAYEQLEKRRNE